MKVGEFSGREVITQVNSQLSQPLDVRAAHQFFSSSSSAGLPDMQAFGGDSLPFANGTLDFGTGTELAFQSGQSLNFSDISSMTQLATPPMGAEAAALLPGADSAVGAAAQGVDVISPVIQLIMKMPGHIGLMSSFFEALSSLFFPATDFFAAFNPAEWFQQMGGALQSIAQFGEHLPIGLSLIPNGAPILGNFGQQMGNSLMAGNMNGISDAAASSATTSHLPEFGEFTQSDLNVGGHTDFGKPIFEQSGAGANPHDLTIDESFPQGQELAFDNTSGAFRPQLGGMQGGTSAGQIPQVQAGQQMYSQTNPNAQVDFGRSEIPQMQGADQQQIMQPEAAQGPPDAGQQVAQSPEAAANEAYTVKPGDNLWDIAHDKFGDGIKWQDIYKLNQDIVGKNPDLIFPGQELNLGGPHDAITAHAAPAHHMPTAGTHHAPTHTAHHGPAHHSASHHSPGHQHHAQPAHPDKVAHAKTATPAESHEASSHQVPQQLAQSPTGSAEQGLKVSQTMGSLKDLGLTE